MSNQKFRYIYGPVPSRRLGRSLGIDLVPYKVCSYDCVYCQLGRTTNKTIEQKEYNPVDVILKNLELKLAGKDTPDYISLAGSGEPTLNSRVGELIRRIKAMTDIPVAVLTNGSLLWMRELQDALMPADLVLPSLDAGDESMFQVVNRPHPDIRFEQMLDGLISFTKRFPGKVWLEVFLLEGLTGTESEVTKIADCVRRIGPTRVQINTVSRPPAEDFALPMSRDKLLALKDLIPGDVEIISEYEECDEHKAVFSDDISSDILALLSRRPCTSTDVSGGLGIHINEIIKYLHKLTTAGKIKKVVSGDKEFYVPADSEMEGINIISAEDAEEAERYLQSCRRDFWQEAFHAESEYLIEHLAGCMDVLSVGCGPAVIETILADHGFKITGLDVSEEALQRAPDEIRAIISRAEEMPLPDASFDAVISITSIQFVDDYQKAIREIARVLRPCGKIIIMLLNPASVFFSDKMSETDSYVQKIKHTDLRAIEAAFARHFDIQTEYFLGIKGHEIFESCDPTYAALYVIRGNSREGG